MNMGDGKIRGVKIEEKPGGGVECKVAGVLFLFYRTLPQKPHAIGDGGALSRNVASRMLEDERLCPGKAEE